MVTATINRTLGRERWPSVNGGQVVENVRENKTMTNRQKEIIKDNLRAYIDYLNGWLYGAVQAVCKRISPINKAE